jgi:TetR/AcrR family transcriptional regulator, repressor of fatR-cypB operon
LTPRSLVVRNEYSFLMSAAVTTAPADKREAVFDAALTLFAERGFHGTSVPDIAKLAAVGAGTIYRYFDGKEALVNALYQHHKRALGQALLADFDPAAPPRVAFHHVWHRAIGFAQGDPRAFQFLELHHHAPYLDDASRALEAELLTMADAFIQAATARQVFKDVPAAVLLALVWGAFRGLVQGECEKRLELTDKTVSQAEECVWEAIRR